MIFNAKNAELFAKAAKRSYELNSLHLFQNLEIQGFKSKADMIFGMAGVCSLKAHTQIFYSQCPRPDMSENQISKQIIGAAIRVHQGLGPGLLESSYKECLFYEITKSGLFVQKEKPIPLIYKQVKLECGYRLDLVVENKVVVEIKSVEAIHDLHIAQTLTYMKHGKYSLGLLINFNVPLLKQGIRRIVHQLEE